MELLDEQGRIFGRVNIIDALVVLFALAIIVAGAALVFGGGGTDDQPAQTPTPTPEPEEPPERTMYVTVVTGGQPATELSTGEINVDGTPANITAVHRTPGPRTYLRLQLDGNETEAGFRFGGNPVRLGDGLTLADETLRTGTRVVERDTDERFETDTTNVTLVSTVRTPVAEAVEYGDRQRVSYDAVAAVTAVNRTAVNETHSDLEVTLELETRAVDGTPHYAGRPVRLGRTLGFGTDGYEFRGDIVERE
ncbi:DUF4330 domain-containing protein [Natronomonas amylolytica]|uniref:DUF4330 domain-containing protein n=1 Tax=Natronomonas amylolytica TaxID=3108498 RepID=UPI00300BE21F